jgi:carbon-monoxide dehydrogenase small subunit
MRLQTEVNGKSYDMDIDPEMRLIDFIREELGLTGTKEGCSEGECGACTIIVNGIAINSCMMLAHQIRGKKVFTIESLGDDDELEQLQKSFIEKGAVQCGFCTPGMLMSAKALFMKTKNPTEGEIKKALEGNLCRCTGYNKILDAVQDAASKVKE